MLCPRFDQHLNLALMTRIRIAERADLDLGGRHTGLDQCVTNGSCTAIAKIAFASIATHGAVESNIKRWILPQVSGDLGDTIHLGSRNVRVPAIKVELSIVGPMRHDADCALGASRAYIALCALYAGGSGVF